MGRWATCLIAIPLSLAAGMEDPCRALVEARDEAKARDCYFEAAAAARARADQRAEATAAAQAGHSQQALGDFEGAIRSFSQALDLQRHAGNGREEGILSNNIATAYWQVGDNRKALQFYEQALKIRDATGDRLGAGITLFGIGNVHAVWGETDQALAAYSRALDHFRDQKQDRWIADILNATGLTYANLGDTGRGLAQYREALRLWRKLGMRLREAYTLNNIGLAYAARREPRTALEYYNRAVPRAREAKDHRGEAYLLNNQGDAYAALNEPARALELYRASLEIKQRTGDRFGRAHTLTRMAEVEAASGTVEAAWSHASEAVELNRQVGNRGEEAVALAVRARIGRMLGRTDAARADLGEGLRTIESLRAGISSRDLRTLYFSSRQDYYSLYIDLLMESGDVRGAFEVSERSRARALLDMLQEARIDPAEGVPPELRERKRTLERELSAAAQRMESGAEPQTRVDDLLQRRDDVEAEIRNSHPHGAALIHPEPLDAAAIQVLLDPQSAVIEFALGSEQSYVWVVTASGISGVKLPARPRIEALVRRALRALNARNEMPTGESAHARDERVRLADTAFDGAARELGRLLLGPLRESIAGKRLVIVPDGALQYLPFTALLEPGSSRRLIVSHEIVRAPSASTLAVLRLRESSRTRAAGTVVAIADPVFEATDPRVVVPPTGAAAARREGSEYTRLRFSRTEAEAITSLAPARSRALLDFRANRSAVLGSALKEYRIVHFATHTEIDNEHPELSRLVLSRVDEKGRQRDGSLRLFEIFNMKLDADLVVLSSCRSGLGREVRGEGLTGLTQGFFHAGAARVVASIWSVEDRSTSVLMQKFYHRMLGGGRTAAAALRSAQLEIAADTRWSSPYYWAAFLLQGDWK